MGNVKNKLLPILCLALCLCIVWGSTTTAHALENERSKDFATIDITSGVSYYYYMAWENPTNYYRYNYQLADDLIYTGTTKLAIYFRENYPFSIRSTGNVNIPCFRSEVNYEQCYAYGDYSIGNATTISDLVLEEFRTNIPLFSSQSEAEAYIRGEIGIENALNYKKVYENGSWVEPFDNVEINDNTVDLPKVSNLSHNGFTLTNNPEDKGYLVEVYVGNGLRSPVVFENGSLGDDIESADVISQYSHTYGLLDPVSDAYNYQTVFDLYVDYGVDNVGTLTQACRNFYTNYPSAKSFPLIMGGNKNTWAVWGQPFGKNYVFWTSTTTLSANDVATIDCYSCPLAFTTYKIRYFYYDDTNGWHYGPWSVYTYFSNGDIGYSSVYQDDEDKILETDTIYGEQDSVTGSINVNTSGIGAEQFINLNNPNELFGYIRSVTNNISATMGNFSMLFATVFTFIPSDIQYMIWLGIAVMIIIGVIKVVKG